MVIVSSPCVDMCNHSVGLPTLLSFVPASKPARMSGCAQTSPCSYAHGGPPGCEFLIIRERNLYSWNAYLRVSNVMWGEADACRHQFSSFFTADPPQRESDFETEAVRLRRQSDLIGCSVPSYASHSHHQILHSTSIYFIRMRASFVSGTFRLAYWDVGWGLVMRS